MRKIADISVLESLQQSANESMGCGHLDVFNSQNEAIRNMSPVGGSSYADALVAGKYRFVEMPSEGIGYRVAAIEANDPTNKPKFIFDKFRNKTEATLELNKARNLPDCQWAGADPSRMIHIEYYKPGATYEDIT